MIALLLEYGADIKGLAADYPAPSEAQRLGRDGTPSYVAAKWGNEETKLWVLEHGANPEMRNEVGETPEEWGERFEKDGNERGRKARRANERKNEMTEKIEETFRE